MKKWYLSDSNSENPDKAHDTLILNREDLQEPKMYQIIMLNDDYTTMEFVIHVLKKFFQKSYEEAESIMMRIHNEGQAICGIYTFEVAETKVLKLNRYSKEKGHPLKCITEPCE